MKYLYHVSQSSESIHLSNIRALAGLLHSVTSDSRVYSMGWGWRSKYRTSSYSCDFEFIFLLQMHFSFIGKAQSRRAMLFCDSSYFYFSFCDASLKVGLRCFQTTTLYWIRRISENAILCPSTECEQPQDNTNKMI